jgi:two-component system OmpR family response regulator
MAEILVVEDELAVLQMLGVALHRAGFAVSLASSGVEAVDLYGRHKGSIDAVLLDVQMPDLDGPQTLAALKRLNPDIKVVFMSANTGIYSMEDLFAIGAARFLLKPFESISHLVKTLSEVMSGRT